MEQAASVNADPVQRSDSNGGSVICQHCAGLGLIDREMTHSIVM